MLAGRAAATGFELQFAETPVATRNGLGLASTDRRVPELCPVWIGTVSDPNRIVVRNELEWVSELSRNTHSSSLTPLMASIASRMVASFDGVGEVSIPKYERCSLGAIPGANFSTGPS